MASAFLSFVGMGNVAQKEKKRVNSGEGLRQILKDLVPHPYITNQKLQPPRPAGEENEAGKGPKQDARLSGDRAEPCA